MLGIDGYSREYSSVTWACSGMGIKRNALRSGCGAHVESQVTAWANLLYKLLVDLKNQ